MHFSGNRNNHDFQIAYFLAGKCFTPDAAYGLLVDQRDSRQDAINSANAAVKKQEAKIIRCKAQIRRAEKLIASIDEDERDEGLAMKLEAEADLEEGEGGRSTSQKCYDAAIAELATLDRYIAELEPMRKYSHLPLPEANELCQAEEWAYELRDRAVNSLISVGHIAADQFSTMRSHPAFHTFILPALEEVQTLLRLGKPHPTAANQFIPISTSEILEVVDKKYKPALQLTKAMAASAPAIEYTPAVEEPKVLDFRQR